MAVHWRLAARFRSFSPISAVWCNSNFFLRQQLPNTGGFEFVRPAAKAFHGTSDAASGGNNLPYGMREGAAQELLWQNFFSDPTKWWDNRRSKETHLDPHFRCKKSREILWLNCSKPAWVESKLALLDAQVHMELRRPPGSVSISGPGASSSSAAYVSDSEIGTCRKLCESGHVAEAVDALNLLVQRGWHDINLLYCLLKRCIAQKDLVLGRRVHALSVDSGYEGNAFLATHLIGLYASRGRLEEAWRVFSKVTTPDAYMWASLILAYARHGEPKQAIGLYQKMLESTVKPDSRIFVAVLKACASAADLAAGKDVHAHVLASAGKPDIFVQNSLVHMYAKCGSIQDARRVFDGLSCRNVVTWNAMIAGYAQQGMGQEALTLYSGMRQEGIIHPDSVTFISLLQACASVTALHLGKQLHAQIEERGLLGDVVVGNSLINMYAKCGSVEDAQRVFDTLPHRDVVTWTALITGYSLQGMSQEALCLYSSMQQENITPPDSVTFVCLLQACASVGVAGLHQGKQLHSQIEERGLQDDVVVGASLVTMYSKCGALEDARRVFDRLTQKNMVTWTAMIGGYAQQGMGQEALTLYSTLQQDGINVLDSVTFACLLQACASVAALPLGQQLHAQIEEQGLQSDVVVTSLINMYSKCGSLENAQHVFDSLPERRIEAWGALIAGYARHGDSAGVFDMVDRMRLEGIQPDGVTFLSVLTVCSHVGLVDEGRKYFESMSTDYGVTPTIEHYTCMMDLLGRAGHLDEALLMVQTMPFQPNGPVCSTLLGACQKWNNVEVGRHAFEFAVKLDERDAAAYVSMSNIYAGAQMWEDAKEMQTRRMKFGAWKEPGQCWWTDMEGVVHRFVAPDRKLLESQGGGDARLERLVLK